MKKFLKFLPVAIFLLAIVALVQFPTVSAQSVNSGNGVSPVCPEDDNWIKVNGTNPSYTAPLDKQIEEICVMGGGFRHYFNDNGYIPYDSIPGPGQGQDEVVSDCWGVKGIGKNVGEAWKNTKHSCGFCPDISHASFKIGDVINPFVRVTYICKAEIDGMVEGYNIYMSSGQHLWRIRHESGPATNFSTNFLSDVQGYIEIGETKLFPTFQNANGVKVITTPENNQYKGTASVSGAICKMEEPKPLCGGYADEYTYDISDWPLEGEFCAVGIIDGEEPTFPAQGEKVTWNCIIGENSFAVRTHANGLNDIEKVICEATRDEEPEEEEEIKDDGEVLGEKEEPKEEEPEPEVLAAATVAITDTAGGNTSSFIAMQVILLISLVSAIWSYFESSETLAALRKKSN
jgi:hypothetical protein